jgi:hypothetical protein
MPCATGAAGDFSSFAKPDEVRGATSAADGREGGRAATRIIRPNFDATTPPRQRSVPPHTTPAYHHPSGHAPPTTRARTRPPVGRDRHAAATRRPAGAGAVRRRRAGRRTKCDPVQNQNARRLFGCPLLQIRHPRHPQPRYERQLQTGGPDYPVWLYLAEEQGGRRCPGRCQWWHHPAAEHDQHDAAQPPAQPPPAAARPRRRSTRWSTSPATALPTT